MVACEDSLNSTLSVNDYANLLEGNYWIYEETVNGSIVFHDTVRVIGVEELNGKSYFVLTGHAIGTKYPERQMVRDSANFLVDRHGTILLTNQTGNTSLPKVNKPEYSISTSIVEEAEIDLGGAKYRGILNRKETIVSHIAANESFVNDNQYANGVGLVRATRIKWPSNAIIVRKLVKFGKSN